MILNKFFKTVPMLILVIISISVPSYGANEENEGTDLRIRWKLGKRYLFEISTDSRQSLEGGMFNDVKTEILTQTQKVQFSVLDKLPGDGLLMEYETLSLKMNIEAGAMKIDFDSDRKIDREIDNTLSAILRQLVDLKFKYYLNKNGKVEKVLGIEKARKLIEKKMSSRIVNSFTLRDIFNRAFVQGLPNRSIKIGADWERSSDLDIPGSDSKKLKFAIKTTFEKIEKHDNKNCALLNSKAHLKKDKASKSSATQTNEPKVTVESGSWVGKTWYAINLGMILESEFNLKMKLKITIPDKDADDSIIKSDLNQKIKLKLLEVSDIPKKKPPKKKKAGSK